MDTFITSYATPPVEVVLDIDGWDTPTHGHQPLSCFQGYYGHRMYYPVLINEATSGYPLDHQESRAATALRRSSLYLGESLGVPPVAGRQCDPARWQMGLSRTFPPQNHTLLHPPGR